MSNNITGVCQPVISVHVPAVADPIDASTYTTTLVVNGFMVIGGKEKYQLRVDFDRQPICCEGATC
jgi:hypothetical protein